MLSNDYRTLAKRSFRATDIITLFDGWFILSDRCYSNGSDLIYYTLKGTYMINKQKLVRVDNLKQFVRACVLAKLKKPLMWKQ